MSLPKVQELRSRAKARMAEARTRVQARGFAGQQLRIGGGQLVNQARARADQVSRRLMERRPGVLPMVKEFRPGQRIRLFFGDREITDLGIGRGLSVEGRPAYPATSPDRGTGMSVFVE